MREIPVTMSAFSIGMFVIAIMVVRNLLFSACMPIAAAVPIKVEINADKSAIIKVVYNAFIISAFSNKLAYHLSENPPHLDRVFELLKDSTINVTIGA